MKEVNFPIKKDYLRWKKFLHKNKKWNACGIQKVYNTEKEVQKNVEMGFEQEITMTIEELAILLENGNI